MPVLRLSLLAIILLVHQVTWADPLGSFFTLQGELQDNGEPVSGSVEFEFEPFDAASGGNSFASPITRTVSVQEGIFTTDLDFGDVPFMGEAVWIEMRIIESGGNVVTLSPRRTVTPTPYAIHAQSIGADTVSSAQILDGAVSAADLANGAVGQNQINSAQVQRRISNACPAGSAIRQVNANGSVICQAGAADDDWLPLGDGRLQNTTGVSVQPTPGTQFPFTIQHNSSITSPTAALIESQQDFARLSFYSEPNPTFWTIAAATAANADEDLLNFYNSTAGDIMTIRGNRRVGIRNTNPQATLHVSGGEVRVDDLAHADSQPRTVSVQTDGTLVANESASKYMTIGPSDFRATNADIGSRIFASVVFLLGASGNLQAPIQLPDDAVIEEVTMYYRDNSAANNITMFLLSGGLGGNSASVLSNLSSTGSASSYRNVSGSVNGGSATVNNQTSFYYINVSASPAWVTNQDLGIQAVVIRYR